MITTFSNDITIKLCEDKCSYRYIKKRRIVDSIEPLTVNGLKITSLKLGDHCKYLGIEESISNNGPLRKEKISKEYLT